MNLSRITIDWKTLLPTIPIVLAGILTMSSFVGEGNIMERQIIWFIVSILAYLVVSQFDARFLKRTDVLVTLFAICSTLLIALFILGNVAKGAQSWFSFGSFSFQPSDIMKLVVVLILAKYFSRRHVEIAHPKHVFISGVYALIPFFLVFLQPDFGSAIIIFFIWFGMAIVSGISKTHLFTLLFIGLVAFLALWFFIFKPYQKDRIVNFIHPTQDITGSGYNAYQSLIAVGSGQLTGKGVGYGTQSRLKFLPEYETDFIFAAYAEEWGFVGVLLIFVLYGILIWRIISLSIYGLSNFEMLFGVGLSIYFITHFVINVGMNINLMPVTGITLPFMSYGGSHLLTEFIALGILSSMAKDKRLAHADDMKNEFLGY
jgi:rod shape determining protein RodA